MKTSQRSRVARQRTVQMDEVLHNVQVPLRPRGGWLSTIRQALGMTKTQLADRLGIARTGVNRLESNELKDSITIASLNKAAEALGCELQYVFVPRKPLENMVWEQALRRAREKLARINQSQALEASAMESRSLSRAVTDLAKEIELRRPADLWND
ncbi:MAG: mobile mystery protein A [Proteobacteria bacterium]|nr:mobile mystery protein A [Pseudomonadota bacterium]MCH8101085.1 mobile mystery protein A [Pseudomonadota bacterium]